MPKRYHGEEARRLTDAEQRKFEIMMLTWTDQQFLDCLEDPPSTPPSASVVDDE